MVDQSSQFAVCLMLLNNSNSHYALPDTMERKFGAAMQLLHTGKIVGNFQ